MSYAPSSHAPQWDFALGQFLRSILSPLCLPACENNGFGNLQFNVGVFIYLPQCLARGEILVGEQNTHWSCPLGTLDKVLGGKGDTSATLPPHPSMEAMRCFGGSVGCGLAEVVGRAVRRRGRARVLSKLSTSSACPELEFAWQV